MIWIGLKATKNVSYCHSPPCSVFSECLREMYDQNLLREQRRILQLYGPANQNWPGQNPPSNTPGNRRLLSCSKTCRVEKNLLSAVITEASILKSKTIHHNSLLTKIDACISSCLSQHHHHHQQGTQVQT